MTMLEIRTYKLVSGASDEFDRLVREGPLPMLGRFGIRVVACAPSADGDDHYCLIRAFSSAAQRQEQLDSFYGSDEWRQDYREPVMGLIESYHTVAVELTAPVREALLAAVSGHDHGTQTTEHT